MELLFALILAFLEVTFISIGVLLLHAFRRQIGYIAFYIALGMLFIFMQFISAAELKVVVGYQGADFFISNSIFFLPILAAVMVVYITEGTIVAQKLILGMLALFGFYIYISYVTSIQCAWGGFAITQGASSETLSNFINESLRNMTGTVLALSLDLFLIPIIFQRLRNLGARIFFAVVGALMITQLFDSVISLTVIYWKDPEWIIQMNSTYIARVFATIWLSIIVTFYLRKIEKGINESRRSLDILFSFVGHHTKTELLKKNLLESEDKYKVVVENASDMIFVIDRNGRILDANLSALKLIGFKNKKNITDYSFFNIVYNFKILPCLWEKLWGKMESNIVSKDHSSNKQLKLKKLNSSELLEVDAAFSKAYIKGRQVLIAICRNVTEQRKLEQEKNDLKDQLFHTQRVESLGRLAGGIAHEFNNILHAIQGHIDIVLLFGKIKDESIQKHLQSVMSTVQKARNITSQLLGFARKNDNRENVVDLRKILNDTKDMFLPLAKKSVDVYLNLPEFPCKVKGDKIQLQQVFLNLLINAMDASKGNSNSKITVTLKIPKGFPKNWKPLKKETNAQNYYELTIEDNGIGMSSETLEKIFEPFYTTKEVGGGTGMGLAMVYGEITNHKGFIHVESIKNVGTTFYIYLPIYREEDKK